LFTRPGIRAQFSAEALPDQPPAPQRLRCPLPVAVIGGFFVLSFLFTFAFPLLHMPLPVILFGHRLNGTLGPAVFALTATLLLAGGLGLLKLKRWSYPLVLSVQFFCLSSSTVTFLSSSYERNMQQVLEEMHLSQPDTVSQMYLHNRPLALAGLLPSVLIILILLRYRERFLTAAKAAETMGG
jgi:glucan phosphoethanolaminetransferase (alkaline phosphatase superfamily)